jgi:hypothetical protein
VIQVADAGCFSSVQPAFAIAMQGGVARLLKPQKERIGFGSALNRSLNFCLRCHVWPASYCKKKFFR